MAKLKLQNPASDDKPVEVEADDPSSVATKVAKARAAQPSWAKTPYGTRAETLRRFGAALEQRAEECAKTLTLDVGKPIKQAMNEVKGTLGRLNFFLSEAEARMQTKKVFDEGGTAEEIAYEPLGVVANISAWNYPYFVGANTFLPALLTGNAVVYKPSEFATRTGQMIARLWQEAGLPPDVFQCVIGDGAVGNALLEQRIDGVFFTGSYATGKQIAEKVASKMVRLQLELGGKDPVYVRSDVDPKAAAEATADGAFYNTGQSCCAVERIYVHEAVYQPFVEHFLTTVKGFVVGDPRDETTYIGPLTRAAQIAVLENQVQDAVKKGAKLAHGGKRLKKPGNWFEPTVLLDVNGTMDVMREESFGPIIGIQKVKSDDEAIRLMNDTEYGLTAGIYTKDEAAARRLLSDVNAGSAYWNCCDRVSPRLPWSGRGHSGVGATLSILGIDCFLKPKAWHLRKA